MIHTDEHFTITYLDPSGFSCFKRCPARFLFSRLMGLRVRGGRAIAPDFGTCIHCGLPYCYNFQTIPSGIAAFAKAWKEFGYDESDPKRNRLRGEAMLYHFASQRTAGKCPYEIVKFPLIQAPEGCNRVSETEIPFLLDTGACYPLAGRIDCAIKWSLDGKLWPCDYKTSSELSDRLAESFWNSPQACSYTYAMSRLTGQDAPGLMIEALRVSPKNDEVCLYPVYVLPHLVENFLEEFAFACKNIALHNESGQWCQEPSGCSSYASYGIPGSNCEYSPLCNSPDWRTIEPLYERGEPFHPFKMAEVKE